LWKKKKIAEKITEPPKEAAAAGSRLHALCTLHQIVRVIKSTTTKRTTHVALMGTIRIQNKMFVARPMKRWEDNTVNGNYRAALKIQKFIST
jgi:hypothetical protein